MNSYLKIQLADGTKQASVRGWADNDIEKLRELSTECDVSKNYGVLCGPLNGIVVIDYDIYKLTPDKQKDYNFNSLKWIHGPDCHIVQTGRGGFHVYHRFDPETMGDWKNITGLDGGPIDVKISRSYVVGPGSIFEGRQYRLLQEAKVLGPMPEEIHGVIVAHQNAEPKKDFKKTSRTEETDELLELVGFTGIRWLNNFEFDCKQKGRGTTCPLCNQTHVNNHFFIRENDIGSLMVKSFSNKCVFKKLKDAPFLFTEAEQNLIENQGYEEDYIKMKREFESAVCFIEQAICYCVVNADRSISKLSPKQLRDRFTHFNYTDLKTEKTKSFIETWVRDENKRSYAKFDFIPEGCPSTTYNLWTGYDCEKIKPDGTGTIQPFLELLGQLTDQDPDYFTKWLAQLFKHPGAKPITSPVITSVQGTGKNSFFDFIGKMMGDELYCETADPDNVLFGRFSSAIERCKLVFIDEMESGTGFKNSAKLKALITNDHHTIEKKGLDAYKIKNYAAIGFASNNPCPVKVEGSDRRFFSYCPKKILEQTFFDNWRVWTKDPQNARAVYDYLMEQDLKGVDWIKDRPMNSAYAEMKYAALPSMIKWLDHLITEDFPTSWACEGRQVDSGALYENYRSWGHNQEKSTVQFGKAIKTLIDKEGLVGIEKGIRTNSGIRYTINQDQVHGWLKSKGYTLSQ